MVFRFPPTVNKYEYIVSKQEPRFPVLSNEQVAIDQQWKKPGGLAIGTVSV